MQNTNSKVSDFSGVLASGLAPVHAGSIYLVIISTILTTVYLIANIMAVKLVSIYGITLFDAGTITIPIAYILGDVLTEIWGFKVARKIIFLSFFSNILLVFFTNIGVYLPAPDYATETAEAYAIIFSSVPRIVCASLCAFLCGEISNAWAMEKIRIATKGKYLWLRSIVSSMLGYILDSSIFVFLAFFGTAPWGDLCSMIFFQYLVKLGLEVLFALPFIYPLVFFLRRNVMN